MSDSPSPRLLSDVVDALREAGCVFAEEEARLLTAQAMTPDDLDELVNRRIAGLPLEHVLGWAEFCGLRIVVQPGVFVPRRRTEFLVDQAVVLARQKPTSVSNGMGSERQVVVDLCCGSGAIGAALAASLERIELFAVDIDPTAVRCARGNIRPAGGRAYVGDLYQPLPAGLRGHVDVLVANAPYVPSEAIALMPPEARTYEPPVALDGGQDGLDVVRRVIAGAPLWLVPGGSLLVESSALQAPPTAAIVAGHGLIARVASSAEHDATVVIGTKPSSSQPGSNATTSF